ncbi:MAG: nitrate reductase [Alphaproteobacteria bacterium]|nr:nitrate reductase [Alphaproteobacteria bacterium]
MTFRCAAFGLVAAAFVSAALFFAGSARAEARAEEESGIPGGEVTEARGELAEREYASVNERCLRCHGMATLSYQDPTTQKTVSLAVDPEKFATSNHARMTCTNCHQDDYIEYPHVKKADRASLTCLGCHRADKKTSRFRIPIFDDVGRQFRRSVHYKALPETFDCFSCHDPHVFEVLTAEAGPAAVVNSDNAICLKCHNSQPRFSALTRHEFPSLKQAHSWLPSPSMHWRSVRCIECHTPRGGNDINHEIVRGEAVERNCVACHTKDSALLTRLYRHRVKEERQVSGLFASMLNNEAYIVGMTRSPDVDALSFFLIGSTVLGLGGHGLLRWLARRRRRS